VTITGDTRSEKPGGAESVGSFVREAMRTQERTLELGQGWAEGLLGTLKDQAESYGVLLRSVDSSLRAVEKAITSQAEATQALATSLEASRQIVSTAMTAQERSLERVETLIRGMLAVLAGQLQALRTQVELGQGQLTGPVSDQSAALLAMTRDWMGAYNRLLGAAQAPFRGA
jgi:hypothetical protein